MVLAKRDKFSRNKKPLTPPHTTQQNLKMVIDQQVKAQVTSIWKETLGNLYISYKNHMS